ncbi:DUF4136 domain-containing protein [Pontibacter chitinilyticus]|uniref:DUF4136 domain-containing protein n=1 Tax=Pontibacter chitinilyticus TaxID=2674989 RepID=UPI003219B638
MISTRTFASCLVLLLLLAGCSPKIAVTAEPATNFNLSDYHTFAFYDVQASGSGLEPNYRSKVVLLQEEIARQLQAKGLQQATNNPDLLVNIGVVVNQQVQTRETDFRTDAPLYIGQRHYTWKSEEVPVGRYKTGTVSIDLVDSNQNELVWRGTAEGILPHKESKLRERIQEGMQQLIGQLPQ